MRTSSCFCKGCLPGQSGEPSAVLDDHRDRLCAYFGVVFWMLALNWTLLPILDPTDDAGPYVYVLRLFAFLLIIAAIVAKNRREQT